MFVACFATTFDAMAQQNRRFEMALFGSSNESYTDLSWLSPGQPQPAAPRRSILTLDGTYKAYYPNLLGHLQSLGYDWSRIAAVVIDEPYWYEQMPIAGENWSNPCYVNDARCQAVYNLMPVLESAATAVKTMNAKTRFWINFSEPELQWMQDPYVPVPLNQPYIDVISLDKYNVPFTQVKPYYDWLVNNRSKPSQQFALVPGVFHGISPYSNPSTAASNLIGYFNYANNVNTNYDSPPVWLVAGWIGAGDEWDGYIATNVYIAGIFASSSWQILNSWYSWFLKPTLNKLSGHLDFADPYGMVVSGWAVDRTKMVSPYVDTYLDGQYVGTTVANQYRPDVGSLYGVNESGFSFDIPWYYNDGGCHTLQVYAIAHTAETHNHALIANTYLCFSW
jgi:hypothetical protein